ncbi:hypothetical protein OEZ86_003617 [Tetradesmus obliquus]|nr:hypothetical protein OEZ86_003617 [Tetradesmus obliquus]
MAGLPELGIDAELAWDADEFPVLWRALRSRRGAALLDALAKCQQQQLQAGALFYGTFAFYKHPKEPDYGAYPIHAATGDDATGTIKTLRLLGLTSAEASMTHRKRPVQHLLGAAQRTLELDTAALDAANPLQLTQQQLQQARLRLKTLRAVAELCDVERRMSQQSPGQTVDAQLDDNLECSSAELYWLRYSRLPAVLEFVVGCTARSFEQEQWSAPAAAGSSARVHEGWDLAPLALVPHSSRDLRQLRQLMAVLRDETEPSKKKVRKAGSSSSCSSSSSRDLRQLRQLMAVLRDEAEPSKK